MPRAYGVLMERTWIRAALMSVLAAAMVGCARTPPGASAPPETEPSVSIRMGPDGPELPEDAVAELNAYGAEHVDEFGGLYVDDQSQGSFVMLFTDHLEEHAAALAEIWPRVTVHGVRFSEAELRALQDSLARELFDAEGIELLSVGVDIIGNTVQVALKSDDPTLEEQLEAAHPGMLDASVFPMPGPWANVESGDGWRLLAVADERSEAYTVRAAENATEWDAMWAAIGLDSDQPEVDFDAEIVVSFGHGLSKSCPELRLDGVRIADGVVYSVTSDPIAPTRSSRLPRSRSSSYCSRPSAASSRAEVRGLPARGRVDRRASASRGMAASLDRLYTSSPMRSASCVRTRMAAQ